MGDTEAIVERPPRWFIPFLVSLTVVIALSSLSSLIFLYCFRKKRIVALGQVSMLAIICLGALMIAVSFAFDLLIQITDPDSKSDTELNAYCSWSMWMLNIGYLTMSTILFCKLYRVHKIMKMRRNQVVHPYHVLGPFIFVLLLGIGTLTAKEVLYPQQYGRWYGSDETFTGPFCAIEKGDLYLEIFIWFISDAIVIGMWCFAYRLRHVSEEIGDGRKCFFIYCFCAILSTIYIIAAILIPNSSLGNKQKYTLNYVLVRLMYFFHTMAFINILILPRMYYVCYKKVYGILPENVRVYGSSHVRVRGSTTVTSRTSTIAATPATTMSTLPPTTTITNTLPIGENSDGENNDDNFSGIPPTSAHKDHNGIETKTKDDNDYTGIPPNSLENGDRIQRAQSSNEVVFSTSTSTSIQWHDSTCNPGSGFLHPDMDNSITFQRDGDDGDYDEEKPLDPADSMVLELSMNFETAVEFEELPAPTRTSIQDKHETTTTPATSTREK